LSINANTNAAKASNALNQGHNPQKLRLAMAATLTIPIFPPGWLGLVFLQQDGDERETLAPLMPAINN
jgi:hypothetical protein